MKIQEELIKEYNGETFVVTKIDGVSKMTFTSGDWIENKEYYGRILLGDCDNCGSTSKLYENFYFDKVLIVGLGMGLLPNYAKEVKNCNVVDVIEKNNELIEYVDYLDSSIKITQADAFDYVPDKKYDLILIDIWWGHEDITEEIISKLHDNYKIYLENNGRILIPVIGSSFKN